jgi:hypothetical protein
MSSWINSVSYDAKDLTLSMKTDGNEYTYEAVPNAIGRGMLDAFENTLESAGSFFAKHIRGRYDF